MRKGVSAHELEHTALINTPHRTMRNWNAAVCVQHRKATSPLLCSVPCSSLLQPQQHLQQCTPLPHQVHSPQRVTHSQTQPTQTVSRQACCTSPAPPPKGTPQRAPPPTHCVPPHCEPHVLHHAGVLLLVHEANKGGEGTAAAAAAAQHSNVVRQNTNYSETSSYAPIPDYTMPLAESQQHWYHILCSLQ
jgi:hypothetical protein